MSKIHSSIYPILLTLALVLTGCGDTSEDNNTSNNQTSNSQTGNNQTGNNQTGNNTSNNQSNNTTTPGCTNTCDTPGETRCNGAQIEACAADSQGCLVWVDGVDCGADGKQCDASSEPAICRETMEGTCSDDEKNQDETDVDCGGNTCDPCPVDRTCNVNSDCATDTCDMSSNQCVEPVEEPTCMDDVQNQGETDVDCGGDNCDPCAEDKSCEEGSDCTTGYCDPTSNECAVEETCSDDTKNQDETGVDCGGTICGPCEIDETCMMASDCMSDNCDIGGTNQCVPADQPTCSDGEKNQDETDVDCGGSVCGACMEGQMCFRSTDCTTNICDFANTGTCIQADPQYEVNEDFETGDFSLFPYEFSSTEMTMPNDWVIEDTAANCHMGSHCMRTNPNQQLGETTSVEVSLSVRQDTTISFWAKVNSEPGQHFFRFYIDGVQQVEVSGQEDWKLYEFNVSATGPNGPNRVFKWEFERADFLDPNHVPWMEVWIDDVDFPNWNTEPTVPEQIRPWNNTLTTNAQPTFEWRSFDPDFDTITYEMQWDTDPAFSNPNTTGETNDTQFMAPQPLNDDTIYYWRVRSKDDSNFRWSPWSPTWSVEVDSDYEYGAIWKQSIDAQFSMNDLDSQILVQADGVVNDSEQFYNGNYQPATGGGSATWTLTNVTPASANTPATLDITLDGDYDSGTEYVDIYVDGTYVDTANPTNCNVQTITINITDISAASADGEITIEARSTGEVNRGACSRNDQVRFDLSYSAGEATMTSVPIDFSTFGARSTWEKIQWTGTGDISIQVLDGQGNLLPDSAVPGNSGGLTSRTIHLWHLEPADYDKIQLRATFSGPATLEEWSVVGNDVYEWLFSYDDDQEGWEGKDRNATPTVSVSGGILRFETTEPGTDPRIVYVLPEPVDATRFTTVEVRVKTSNNYRDDDVTFFWQSNFGLFDDRRSFVQQDVFLLDFQDLSFDLTQTPMSPNEPWRGQIEAIRLDPVNDFFDQLDMTSDGWFEIDRIAIY